MLLLLIAACSKDKVVPVVTPNTATWTIDDTIVVPVSSVKITKLPPPNPNGAYLDISLVSGSDSLYFNFVTFSLKQGVYYAEMGFPTISPRNSAWKDFFMPILDFSPPDYSTFTIDSIVNNKLSGSYVLRSKFIHKTLGTSTVRVSKGKLNSVPMN
jgi:hypothetical protein